jgi:hypothetical protein
LSVVNKDGVPVYGYNFTSSTATGFIGEIEPIPSSPITETDSLDDVVVALQKNAIKSNSKDKEEEEEEEEVIASQNTRISVITANDQASIYLGPVANTLGHYEALIIAENIGSHPVYSGMLPNHLPLPAWIRVDSVNGHVIANPPLGVDNIEIVIQAHSSSANSIEGNILLIFNQE